MRPARRPERESQWVTQHPRPLNMSANLRPRDAAGSETLEIMRDAPRYNAWQFRRIASHLGRRVCEIGSGVGNMSRLILSQPRESVVLTDTDPFYLETLRATYGNRPGVSVEPLTLPDSSAPARFRRYGLDTVVALNVIEHISEDVEAMRSIAEMLSPAGRLVILVPAVRALYGSLDEELGHARRYSRSDLVTRMERAGFSVERVFYFNLLGTLGWWLNARLRRVPRIPRSQLRLFDALVPLLQAEDYLPLPFGQSLVGIGIVR
jgi:SAM-dependent methyltransferase